MRTLMTLAIVLLVTAAPGVAQSAADEAAIKKAHEQRITAWNAKDVKAYLPFLDKDCTSRWDGSPCAPSLWETGKFPEEAIKAQVKLLEEIGVTFITPEVAIYRYTSEASGYRDADGKTLPPGRSHRADVYVKKDDKWLVVARFRQPVEE